MKKIMLGGVKLSNGVFVKRYPVYIYDGDLSEMPEDIRFNFENQMYASAHVPTTLDGIVNLSSRLRNAIKHIKEEPDSPAIITSNLVHGLHQRMQNFTCKDNAFYYLIKGVTNFDDEHVEKKMKLLYSHGLNRFETDSICEDVKKKYIPNYSEISRAYTKAEYLIGKY